MNDKHLKHAFIILLLSLLSVVNPSYIFAEDNEQLLMTPLKLSITKTDNYYIDLEDILKLAIQNNIPLMIAEEQAKIDKLDVYTAYSELLPDVIPSYEQSRFQGGFQFIGSTPFIFARTTIGPKLALEYKLFSGGENIYKILAAKRNLKATKYSISHSKDTLLYDASAAYYELQKAMKNLEIAKKEIDESEATLNLNKKRLEVGFGTILEVSQSEDQLAISKRKLIDANKNILKRTQELNRILNLPLEINITPKSTQIDIKNLIENVDMNILLNLALDNRDDLNQLKSLKEVYMAQRGIARSKFFPTVSLTAYWGGTGPRFKDLNEQRFIGYGVRLDFLKNLGVNYIANYKKSAPMLKQVDLELEQKLRNIETEISDSFLDYECAEREIIVAKTGLKAAEDTYKFATERLEAGVGTNIDVLSAQVRLTTARTNLLNSVIEYNKSQIALMKSIGVISIDKILGNEPLISDNTQQNSTTEEPVTKPATENNEGETQQ